MTGAGSGSAAAWLRELTGARPDVVARAPGRVNLIGEHTDYNGGHVLPFAVPLYVEVAALGTDDGVITMHSRQRPDENVRVALPDLRPGAPGGWGAYAAGTAWALAREGVPMHGAVLVVDGGVPVGSGLSSSAALECAAALALLALAGVQLEAMEVAALAQRAENEFVGVPCGLMDQAASMLGRVGHATLLDCRSRESRSVPVALDAHGLALLVTDTHAPHRHVDGAYAARRADSERAAALLGVRVLRDVDDLDRALAQLDDQRLRRRVRHVVSEDRRVLAVADLLDQGRLPEIGPLLDASHESLRCDYEVSCRELDLAVTTARRAGALGARMTGGGFGGCSLALVPAHEAESVSDAIIEAFAASGLTAPSSRVLAPVDGACLLGTGAAG